MAEEKPIEINSIADIIVNLPELKDRVDRALFGMTESEFVARPADKENPA